MTEELKKVGRRETRSTGVNLDIELLVDTDLLRGDIPRSRWIERALRSYNERAKIKNSDNDNNNNQTGVWGSPKVTSHVSHQSTSTIVDEPSPGLGGPRFTVE